MQQHAGARGRALLSFNQLPLSRPKYTGLRLGPCGFLCDGVLFRCVPCTCECTSPVPEGDRVAGLWSPAFWNLTSAATIFILDSDLSNDGSTCVYVHSGMRLLLFYNSGRCGSLYPGCVLQLGVLSASRHLRLLAAAAAGLEGMEASTPVCNPSRLGC